MTTPGSRFFSISTTQGVSGNARSGGTPKPRPTLGTLAASGLNRWITKVVSTAVITSFMEGVKAFAE